MCKVSFRPLISAVDGRPRTERAGLGEAFRHDDLAGRSAFWRPSAADHQPIEHWAPRSGNPIMRPTTGSATPATSSVTSNTTVVSTSLTPGMAAMRRSVSRGALLMSAKTWPKRADS